LITGFANDKRDRTIIPVPVFAGIIAYLTLGGRISHDYLSSWVRQLAIPTLGNAQVVLPAALLAVLLASNRSSLDRHRWNRAVILHQIPFLLQPDKSGIEWRVIRIAITVAMKGLINHR
jgi:hypothetical protein